VVELLGGSRVTVGLLAHLRRVERKEFTPADFV
jgi:hypothetical protein